MTTNYDSRLWEILEKNRLVDLSQFHKPSFYEEVPLHSRRADISFLSRHTNEEASRILLKFALKFLKAVVSYEEHEWPFFAAVTISEISPDDPIVPNLFVWSNPVHELFENLTLKNATTAFAKKISRLVLKSHLPDMYEVLEDTATNPDFPRAFVAPSIPPYRGFVPIYMFCKPLGSQENANPELASGKAARHHGSVKRLSR